MTYKNPNYLIESSELLERLDTPNLRVFDTAVFLHAGENGYQAQSGRELYQEGHIPAAGFIDLIDDWADTTNPLNFTIPSFFCCLNNVLYGVDCPKHIRNMSKYNYFCFFIYNLATSL